MSEGRMKFLDEVDYSMLFTTYNDFKSRRIKIWEQYKTLTYRGKVIFKMYVYSSCYLRDKQKDEIWEFLNGFGIDYLCIDNNK